MRSRRVTLAANPGTSRRDLLKRWLPGAALVLRAVTRPTASRAAGEALLSPDDAAARKLKYTEDAGTAKRVPAGATCASCALYQGAYGSLQGPCQIFPGKQVKATGWCSSWAPQM